MGRSWTHESSVQWLRARSGYLTASDIRRLLTDYKKVASGKIDIREAQQFAKLYGEKMTEEFDPESHGPAARGHYMEPFALEEFCEKSGERLEWWDDRILVSHNLGFSPDALDIPPIPFVEGFVDSDGIRYISGVGQAPTRMAEIKCYEAGNHYQRLNAVNNGIPLEERWQVACGMVVCPSIAEGAVVFYAPQCRNMFSKRYLRTDLLEEMDVIKAISNMWDEFVSAMNGAGIHQDKTKYRESDIYNRYMLDSMFD